MSVACQVTVHRLQMASMSAMCGATQAPEEQTFAVPSERSDLMRHHLNCAVGRINRLLEWLEALENCEAHNDTFMRQLRDFEAQLLTEIAAPLLDIEGR